MIGEFSAHAGDRRQRFRHLVKRRLFPEAVATIKPLWDLTPSISLASAIVSALAPRGREAFRPKTLFIARSSTIEPLIPVLRAAGYMNGFHLDVRIGDFNTYEQEMLDSHSGLYLSKPDAVFVAADARSVCPDLWYSGHVMTTAERRNRVEEVASRLSNLIRTFRGRSPAQLLMHGLEVPRMCPLGLLDEQAELGLAECFRDINARVRVCAKEMSDVYVLDIDRLVARSGPERWTDEAKWITARTWVSASCVAILANEWIKYLCATSEQACKLIVTDLDNTLWGGVVGEDGVTGIRLDGDVRGNAYVAVQRCLKEFTTAGGLLAVCSKNNPDDAEQVFASHPGMILNKDDFAAFRINWNDKPANIQSIAEQLSLGLRSIVFLDDNPVEREIVRCALPEVDVPELPDSPFGFEAVLRNHPRLARVAVSAEDLERRTYYQRDTARQDARREAGNLEDFYWSLRQVVRVVPADRARMPRIAQLTQKTNQFNLTTRRYTDSEILNGIDQAGWAVFGVQVLDSFGDNGIVGVVITRPAGLGRIEIDTFLLSCRVIGRTVETAMLAILCRLAEKQAVRHLIGLYLPTVKNEPCKDFYARHGFARSVTQSAEGYWVLDLSAGGVACPPWIIVEGEESLPWKMNVDKP